MKERMIYVANETLEVIRHRRSIRKYKPEQIADAELQLMLDAAIYAPNAMNQQKWHFTVIQNKKILDDMVNIIKENIMKSGIEFLVEKAKSPDYHTFYNAPTVILISGDSNANNIQIDCGLAAQNITLSAESLNIGSCVITSSAFLFASEKGKELKKVLGIPDGYNHICTIAIGYKDEQPEVPPRNRNVFNYVR
jgi:nitroreductase